MEPKDIQASFKYNEVVDEVKIKTRYIKHVLNNPKSKLTLEYENVVNIDDHWFISDYLDDNINYGRPYINNRKKELKRIEDGDYITVANFLYDSVQYLNIIDEPIKAHVIKTIANELKWGI